MYFRTLIFALGLLSLYVSETHAQTGGIEGNAVADETAFRYEAPDVCPEREHVRQELLAIIGASALAELAHAPIIRWLTIDTLRAAEHEYQIRIEFVLDGQASQRTFEGTDCRALSDAAAAAVGLWLSSDDSQPREPAAATGTAPPPTSTPPSPIATSSQPTMSLAAHFASELSLLSRIAFGASLGLGLEWRDVVVDVSVRYTPFQNMLAAQDSTLKIDASTFVAAVLLGPKLDADSFRFALLGGLEGGAIFANPSGLVHPTANAAPVFAVDAALRVQWLELGAFVIEARLDVAVPVVRGVFQASPYGDVLRTQELWTSAEIGVRWRFE